MTAELESAGEGLARRLPQSWMVQCVVDLVRPLAQAGGERAKSPARLTFRVHRLRHDMPLPHDLGVAGQGVHKARVGRAEESSHTEPNRGRPAGRVFLAHAYRASNVSK
jgi:hypothetical protein